MKSRSISALCIIVSLFMPALSKSQVLPDSSLSDTTKSVSVKSEQEGSFIKRIQTTGFIQAQFQMTDSAGAPSFNGGNFPPETDNRFIIRRARIRFQYNGKLTEAVVHIDANESAVVSLKDAYFRFSDPFWNCIHLTVGVFFVPFGYEIHYLSRLRESPERGRLTQELFPGERDMGFMLSLNAPEKSKLNFLRLDAAILNGNGQSLGNKEFDSYKDFCGRLSMFKESKDKRKSLGIGLSIYQGGWRLDNDTLYKMASLSNGTEGREINTGNDNNRTKRSYFGADLQATLNWKAGTSIVRAEFISGIQSTALNTNTSPTKVVSIPGYERPIFGAIFYYVQNIGTSKFQTVIKYDWFDPNTKVSGKEIGGINSGTDVYDIRFDTWSLGVNYLADKNIRLSGFFDLVKNEETGLSLYTTDRSDNVFTLRLQYRFP